ncbi:MAG: protein kinase [Nitrococcus sp.]|nr:protein kinase [Nitrococcus sp.]
MKIGEVINGYRLYSDGTTTNGGRSVWAFATKGKEHFFIKQFLSPKYPVPGQAPGSEKRKRMLMEKCQRFEKEQNRFMAELRNCVRLGGNLIVPIEFVRVDSFYYKIALKVDVSSFDVSGIAELPFENKLVIATTAAHSVAILHQMRIAHGDLKPNNLLINKTAEGEFVAKLIDFDESFFEGEVNENPGEVVSDFVYYSPELLRYIKTGGDELRAKVTCKSDIFSLGIIYYQYFHGRLPKFNKSKYQYLAVSVLDGKTPGLGGLRVKNKKLAKLIGDMLAIDPNDRPSATQVVEELKGVDCGSVERGTRTLYNVGRWLSAALVDFKKKISESEKFHFRVPRIVIDIRSSPVVARLFKRFDFDASERSTRMLSGLGQRLKGMLLTNKQKGSHVYRLRFRKSRIGRAISNKRKVGTSLKGKLLAKEKGKKIGID